MTHCLSGATAGMDAHGARRRPFFAWWAFYGPPWSLYAPSGRSAHC